MPEVPVSASPSARADLQSSGGSVTHARFFTTRNLSVLVTGSVLLAAIFKADKKDIPQIIQTVTGSGFAATLGWAIALIILVASVIFVRLLMKIHDREVARMANERDALQRHLLKGRPTAED